MERLIGISATWSLVMQDQFDEIATDLLLSDADLALTFVQLGLSTSNKNRRDRCFGHARIAYKRICESISLVQFADGALVKLGAKLEQLRALLDGEA